MKQINDPKLTAELVEQYRLRQYFDTEDLVFQLHQYQRGEILCSPLNPIGHLLFPIRGSAQIYSLHPDGWKLPVAVVSAAEGQIFGDIEFGCGKPTPFFAEAREETLCLALSIPDHLEQLHRDVRFLHHILRCMSEKFDRYSNLESAALTMEEKVTSFLEARPGREIASVEETALHLRYSRRQLQRVLKKLCEEGVIEKTGRGAYRLTDQTGI